MIPITKTKFSLCFWILLYLLFAQAELTKYSFFYANRIFFSIVLILSIVIYLIALKKIQILSDLPTKILVISFSILFLYDLIKQNYVIAVGNIVFILILLTLNTYNYKNIFKQIILLNKLINFFSFFSVIGLLIYLLYLITHVNLYNFLVSESNILSFLFKADGNYSFFGIAIPQYRSLTQQSSIVPVVLMLPLAIFFLFSNEYRKFYYTIIVLFICFGGSAYMAIIVAFILYFIIDKLPKLLFTLMPFIVIIIFSISVSTFLSLKFDEEEKALIMEVEKSREIARNSLIEREGNNYWMTERTSSGFERLVTYSYQIEILKKNIFFGSSNMLDYGTLGSTIIKMGIRGGLLVMFLISIFFYSLLNNLFTYLKIFPQKKLGIVLIYSLIIQAFVYNENGFMSLFSFTLFFLASKLIREKINESRIDIKWTKTIV